MPTLVEFDTTALRSKNVKSLQTYRRSEKKILAEKFTLAHWNTTE